jgi:hypothetical protein
MLETVVSGLDWLETLYQRYCSRINFSLYFVLRLNTPTLQISQASYLLYYASMDNSHRKILSQRLPFRPPPFLGVRSSDDNRISFSSKIPFGLEVDWRCSPFVTSPFDSGWSFSSITPSESIVVAVVVHSCDKELSAACKRIGSLSSKRLIPQKMPPANSTCW